MADRERREPRRHAPAGAAVRVRGWALAAGDGDLGIGLSAAGPRAAAHRRVYEQPEREPDDPGAFLHSALFVVGILATISIIGGITAAMLDARFHSTTAGTSASLLSLPVYLGREAAPVYLGREAASGFRRRR